MKENGFEVLYCTEPLDELALIELRSQTLNPKPCTLNPKPYTLNPTTYTLHPTP